MGILIWKPLDQMTIEENDKFCLMKEDQFAASKDIPILAFDHHTNRLIGGGGLHQCDWKKRTFSLGYWVRTTQTGKGYATEIATALVNYAFTTLSASHLTSSHGKGNGASQKILEKLGFQRTSISQNDYKMMDGSFIDNYHYQLSKGIMNAK